MSGSVSEKRQCHDVRDRMMHGATFRGVVCVVLILSQVGCRSVYRFQCTSCPPEAGVVIGEEMVGETPCQVEVPRDSEWIQDGRIEFTFCLPDGRERKKVVDLHRFKSSHPLAETVATPFWVVGGGLIIWAAATLDDDDDSDYDEERDDDDDDAIVTGLAGFGVLGIGAAVYGLLGGKSEGLRTHKVLVYFDEPAGEQESQTPAAMQSSQKNNTDDP